MKNTNMKLRNWSLEDVDSLVHYANNPKIAANLTNNFPHPYTKESGQGFIRMAMQGQPNHIKAITINDEAVGGIGLHLQNDVFCKNAEIGYWLGEPFWGKGIITKAIIEMVEYGFRHWDINRIYARPFGTNIGSQRALEKAGFTLEARFKQTLFKNGTYHDELVYGIRK